MFILDLFSSILEVAVAPRYNDPWTGPAYDWKWGHESGSAAELET